ncbi:hypothetical protein PORY_000899 [Pneumocystis oryctolagi]|uniref:Uncharacterized protein n=1 Tax=Pneumocystis oryctolagi TaxID=42067 RepID=A0ACB7CJ22_9ASCO|nr:hypothetical protein PORY_000899 [Pneumocystis oryctolagi]
MFNPFFLHRSLRHLTYSTSSQPSFIFKGLLTLAAIPVITFGLGTWQYYRLQWKRNLIQNFEERLSKEPLKLTKDTNFFDLRELEYQRVSITGKFKHDEEILVGPLIFEGKNGYNVITPMEIDDGCSCLINRGWIPFDMADQSKRTEGLSNKKVTIQGLIRLPPKNNLFTPSNKPELKKYYHIDIKQMSESTRSQPIYIEQILEDDFIMAAFLATKGSPIGKIARLQIRNNHLEYMFTWYTLSVATSVMLYYVSKTPSSIGKRMNHIKKIF